MEEHIKIPQDYNEKYTVKVLVKRLEENYDSLSRGSTLKEMPAPDNDDKQILKVLVKRLEEEDCDSFTKELIIKKISVDCDDKHIIKDLVGHVKKEDCENSCEEKPTLKEMPTHWGIISAGKISNDFVAALKSLPEEEHKIIGVAARNITNAEEFAKKYSIPNFYGSYEEVIQHPFINAVYIGVIHPQHFEVAKLSLECGKNVLCEKPLCMNEKETRQLIELAKEKKLFLMEGVWSRCFPVYEHLRTLLANRAIGDVLYMNVQFGAKIDVDRMCKKELGGGTVLDIGIYTIQIATLVFGNKPSTIVAGGHLNKEGVDQDMVAVLTYPSGGTAVLSTHSKVALPNTALIVGTKGSIEIQAPFWAPTKITLSGDCYKEEKEFPLPHSKYDFNFVNSVGFSYEAAEVRRCILAELLESPLITHEDSINLARLEDEIRRQLGVHYPQDDN